MKDGYISKLTITKNRYWAIQFKKIIDTLSILCADKKCRYIDDIICMWNNLQEATFSPLYPDLARWPNTYSVETKTINPVVAPDANNGGRHVIISLVQKTHVSHTDFYKQLLLNYEQKSKTKAQE